MAQSFHKQWWLNKPCCPHHINPKSSGKLPAEIYVPELFLVDPSNHHQVYGSHLFKLEKTNKLMKKQIVIVWSETLDMLSNKTGVSQMKCFVLPLKVHWNIISTTTVNVKNCGVFSCRIMLVRKGKMQNVSNCMIKSRIRHFMMQSSQYINQEQF